MEYELIRSKRKTLAITVSRDGIVTVRAPMRTSKAVIESFVNANTDWIEKSLKAAAERLAAHPEPDKDEEERLKRKAHEIIPPLVERYSAITGLVPVGIKITGAKTRFGSCSGRNSLCFSWRLMQYPDECIEYVVLHELAHIKHKNHGKDFYALIASFMPDYKRRIKLLKK